jgi:hypothetical protein
MEYYGVALTKTQARDRLAVFGVPLSSTSYTDTATTEHTEQYTAEQQCENTK